MNKEQKNVTKLLSFLLAMIMIITMLPETAFALEKNNVKEAPLALNQPRAEGITTVDALNAAISASNGSAGSPTEITIDQNITVNKVINVSGKHVKLVGGGTLSKGAGFNNNMIAVTNSGSLTLANITLDGNKENVTQTKNLVYVEDSTLTTEDGAVLQNNKDSAVRIWNRNSVFTSFIMDGGTIQGNEAATGAAVTLTNTAPMLFQMNDGTIQNNISKPGAAGGGSIIHEGGSTPDPTIEINGGEIKNNEITGADSSSTYGTIYSNGTLKITGGTISNNTTNGRGGGVYKAKGTMLMTGGTIQNNTDRDNTAKSGNNVYINKGTFNLGGTANIPDGLFIDKSNKATLNIISSLSNNIGLQAIYNNPAIGDKVAGGENYIIIQKDVDKFSYEGDVFAFKLDSENNQINLAKIPNPPVFTEGDVVRISDYEATIKFELSQPGKFYYGIVDKGASAPTIDTSGEGFISTLDNTFTINDLAPGAKDVYITAKNSDQEFHDPVKISIPAYTWVEYGDNTIIVNDIAFDRTSDRKIKCGSGTADFRADDQTLYLDNAEILNTSSNSDYNGIMSMKGLNIVLSGNNVIGEAENTRIQLGISVDGPVEISGNGTLSINTKSQVPGQQSSGITVTEELMIKDATIHITDSATATLGGINMEDIGASFKTENAKITISGYDTALRIPFGMINIKNSTFEFSKVGAGIRGGNSKDITIDKSILDISATMGSAIFTEGTAALKIVNGSKVTAESMYSTLIGEAGITINDSTVETTAGSDSEGYSYTGIYTPQVLTINGSSNVTANGDWRGMEGGTSIIIDGTAKVIATGSNSGIQSNAINILGETNVKATSTNASAIGAFDNISITGNANVIANGAQSGIASNGTMNLSGKNIEATGGWYGINNEGVNASGITIGGKLKAVSTGGHAINGTKNITADANADISATGAWSGIQTAGNITFTNSKVHAVGNGGCGINTTAGKVTMTGGSIYAKGSSNYVAIRAKSVQSGNEAAESKITLTNLIEKNGGKLAFNDWLNVDNNKTSWTTIIDKDDEGIATVPGGFTNGLLEVWLAEPHSVIFDVNGTTSTVEVYPGNNVTAPADPSKENNHFSGWYLNDVKFDITSPITADVTLTAKFAAHTPNADDGDCTTAILCSECGVITTAAKTHTLSDWQKDETNHFKKCTNTGCTHTEQITTHTWSEDVEITLPTYVTDGKKIFTCNVCGHTMEQVIPKLIDSTLPDASVSIQTSKWNEFLNTITFELFYKETQSITVTASDDESGISSVEYLLSTTVFTDANSIDGTWNALTLNNGAASFNVNPNSKQYIYVKVTDKQGNTKIINSEGIVLYSNSALTSATAEFNFDKHDGLAIEMTLNDNTLNSIKDDNTVLVKDTDYTINGNIVTIMKEYLTTALGDNGLTLTFMFNPMGVITDKVTISDEFTITKHIHTPEADDDDCTTPIKCSLCGHVLTTANDEHIWNSGVVTKEPSYTEGGEKIYSCSVCSHTKIEAIAKLPSKEALVEGSTGTKAEYENGEPFDSSIILSVVSKPQEEMDKFKNSINKVAPGLELGGLFDVKLLKDGVEIQPDGNLKISIPLSDTMKTMSNLQIVYIDDEGNTTIIPSKIKDGMIVFVTDHFSYYGVIGKVKATIPDSDGDNNSDDKDTPDTGDNSSIMLFVFLMMASSVVLVIHDKKRKTLN